MHVYLIGNIARATNSDDPYSSPLEIYGFRAVVVAQLVERSLPTPEDRGSNPVLTKINNYG